MLEEMKVHPVSGTVNQLDIEIGAASFRVETVPGGEMQVQSDLKNITVKQRGDKLVIEEKGHWTSHVDKVGTVLLIIPENYRFDRVELETGAGTIRIDKLDTLRLDLDLGTGETTLDALYVSENADIDSGAGRLTIGTGSIRDLDLDLGVGEARITAQLLGNSKIDCGVGSTALTLLGSQEDYTVKVETGLGQATVAGVTAHGEQRFGSGSQYVSLDGGVGSIRVDFQPIN